MKKLIVTIYEEWLEQQDLIRRNVVLTLNEADFDRLSLEVKAPIGHRVIDICAYDPKPAILKEGESFDEHTTVAGIISVKKSNVLPITGFSREFYRMLTIRALECEEVKQKLNRVYKNH